ncbi:MAG: hypothetical protein SFT81_04950 [Candidatus Caenarcaniphilales bacterium]|nr:hypothetical protein [Candidatus Caenarcaniphilales bacterium]
MFKKLTLICALFAVFMAGQQAKAVRFGLNTGFYNEQTCSNCGSSREFGFKIGAYIDPSPQQGGCCSAPLANAAPAIVPPPMPCGCCVSRPRCGCGAPPIAPPLPVSEQSHPVIQPRTEVYLLVLPQQYLAPAPQQYQPAPQYYQETPQYYYQEQVPQNQPVRGLW